VEWKWKGLQVRMSGGAKIWRRIANPLLQRFGLQIRISQVKGGLQIRIDKLSLQVRPREGFKADYKSK
jgi:hypothetical protein